MFPDEDKERKFGMQEKVLAEALGGVLGVEMGRGGRGEVLREWRDGEDCLGKVVGDVVWEKNPDEEAVGPLSLLEVDSLLSELAALSIWSNSSFRSTSTGSDSPGRRTRKEILRTLYTDLPPRDACYLTQIILKDLRPVLYPTPGRTTAESLLGFKSDSVKMLSKEDAMRLWDDTGMMRKAFDARGTFEEAALVFEGGEEQVNPVVGKKLQIPKCVKGQGCKQALRHFKDASTVYAETKYDGERVQLHFWLDEHGVSHIKIYSKSGRDSTLDRAALHPLIRDVLQPGKHWQKSLILEAEMVAWSDELSRVDEFWRIRSLVESTAIGGRARYKWRTYHAHSSQCSIISDASDSDTRHLSLIFFDVLLIDSKSLLPMPYTRRRTLLSSIVSPLEHGRVMLAESWPIDMSKGMEEGARQLREIFAGSLAGFEEGLVLKDGDSGWRNWRRPWVKLKKDYITGYGDCVDMVVMGAGWDKDRARELKVGPETLTTFYLGVQTNDSDTRRDPKIKPHFEMFMLVSYGLSREQLEDANFRLKGLPYTFAYSKRLPPPTVMMHEPLLAEVFGAGFTKDRGAKNYTLRFPRMTKLHRTNERSWRSAVSMSQFDKLAHEAVGRESSKDE
ncbi:DNA ligase/mRNA capping enzyme, partial [Stereum hirsutum FP-91666 SS1]|uniref:DNA ligase/mRNA capping enzyme n=1 Tax=Stereum hirsutum (strain FP-91666) TaxID=721885 RepID=UPI000440F5C9